MKISDSIFIRFFHNQAKRLSACEISIDGTKTVASAKCHTNDAFDKKKGRNLALNRAIKAADLARPNRIAIWTKLNEANVHMY